MSVERFDFVCHLDMGGTCAATPSKDKDGDYVRFEDYAELQAEVAARVKDLGRVSVALLAAEAERDQLKSCAVSGDYVLVADMDEGFDPRYGEVLICTRNCVKEASQPAPLGGEPT